MSDKNVSYEDDNKKVNLHSSNKFEHELYHVEDNVVEKIFRVKRIAAITSNAEKWKIFEDDKVTWIIDGKKLSKKEKEFIRTIDGVNFLITECKKGIKSFNYLKTELKKKLK